MYSPPRFNPQDLELTATPGPRRGSVNLEARHNGQLVDAKTFRIEHLEHRVKFAQKLGIDPDKVTEAITRLAPPANGVVHAPTAGADAAGFIIMLRGMRQPLAQGRSLTAEKPLACLQSALAITDHAATEPVIEWSGTELLAVLDVDFHDRDLDDRPAAEQLDALARAVRPRPALWWRTHGRGLRLVYEASQGFTAAELAACASASLRSLSPEATTELLAHTRHPAYRRPDSPEAGPVMACTPTVELGSLAKWLARELDDSVIEEWLAERGLEKGRSYEHSSCPIDAQTASHGEPVYVGDDGVYCHKCAATGITLGSKRPGWFSWAALLGGGLTTRLRTALRHCCHWEHAKHLMAEDVGLNGPLAMQAYRALLKALHGADDPRLEAALHAGWGLIRMDGCWTTADMTRNHKETGLSARLVKLPAVCYLRVDDEGRKHLAVDSEKLGIFQGVDDLQRFGYARVQPIRGMKIAYQWRTNPDPGVVHAVILPPALQRAGMEQYQPRYLPLRKRLPIQGAEAILEKSFPGINFNYLRLLIAARGCAEANIGMPPRIAVDGPSGAGKSFTVRVAAALIGDQHRDVSWTPDLQEFHMALYEASQVAGLVTSDEIIKRATAKHPDAVLTNLNALLTFDRDATVRKLYVGPVPVHQLPALIITDISYPREVLCDEQLGRRFVRVHLDRKVDWQPSILSGIENWRTAHADYARAANTLVSDVIDKFFAAAEPMPFEQIARQLGFGLLNQDVELGQDPEAELRALFDACCSPEAIPAPENKWKGQGWRLVRRESEDPLSVAWRDVCDNMGAGFASSRRVKEADWALLLGTHDPVECDVSASSQLTLAIRFRSGKLRAQGTRFNEEIRQDPPAPEPPPPSEPPPPPPESPRRPAPPAPAARAESAAAPRGASSTAPATDSALPIFIDLETRSADNLSGGGRRYALHSTTELLSAVALFDRQVVVWTPLLDQPLATDALWPAGFSPALPVRTFAGPSLPGPIEEAIRSGRPLCAHNAYDFDRHVWTARKLPAPTQWLDTLPHARAAGLPGKLEELGQLLLGMGKDRDGAEVLQRLCQPAANGMFVPLHPADAVSLVRYNIADVLLLARIYGKVYGHAEEHVLQVDRVINDRGIAFDTELAGRLIELEAQAAARIAADLEQITGGQIRGSDLARTQMLLHWLRARGVDIPDLQKETVRRLLEEQRVQDPVAVAVLAAREAHSRITTSKLEKAIAMVGPDRRLRDLLVYHKAHTGRWAGRLVQPHNLPRPHHNLKDLDPLLAAAGDADLLRSRLPAGVTLADALSALVRPCFRAAPGKILCIADYAAIEARGVAWCANETGLLDKFAKGADVYIELAGQLFGRPITDKSGIERQIGKEAVLGCGYQMGKDKFAARCVARGVDLAAAGTTAEAVVEGYRDTYPAIAGQKVGHGDRTYYRGGLWRDVEYAAREAILGRGYQHAGRCSFCQEGAALVIGLPSGRRLIYRNARIEDKVPDYCTSQELPARAKPTIVFDAPHVPGITTYGGKLVENIVQAICRDLLVAAILQCESEGLPVVLHVHDELVIEVPAAEAEAAVARLAEIMATPPSWAVGFPIAVEAYATERYLKSPPAGAPQARRDSGRPAQR